MWPQAFDSWIVPAGCGRPPPTSCFIYAALALIDSARPVPLWCRRDGNVRVFRVALAALKSASADLRGNSRQEFRSPQLLEVMNSFPVAAFRSNVSNVRVSCYAAHFSVFSLTQFLLATILRSGTSDNDKCFLGSASEGKAFFNVSNRDFRTTFTIIEESIKKLRPAVLTFFTYLTLHQARLPDLPAIGAHSLKIRN